MSSLVIVCSNLSMFIDLVAMFSDESFILQTRTCMYAVTVPWSKHGPFTLCTTYLMCRYVSFKIFQLVSFTDVIGFCVQVDKHLASPRL